MSAYNTTLLDEDDNEIYPKTLAENVYDGNTRMDQKVDGIRIDLGNPSSASAVTGADAFSKISKLNSDLVPQAITNAVTPVQNRMTINSQKLYKIGKICVLNINFTSNSSVSNQLFATINPAPIDGSAFIGDCVDTSDNSVHQLQISNSAGYIGGFGALTSGHTFTATIIYISA